MPPDPDPILVGLGTALRDTRLSRRMSQEELGLATGVHWNYIGGIERAERNPSVLTLGRLAKALDIRLSDLFAHAEGPLQA